MIFKADAPKSKKFSVKSIDVCDYSFDDFVKTFVSDSSPSFPPTKEHDSFWEEVDEFLAIDTIPFSKINNSYFDSEGDTIFLNNLLNDELSIPPDKAKKKIELKIDDSLEPELEEFLPNFESFSFDTTEEMSGNPTYRFDFSDTTYETFHFNHSEETSRGNTTSHAFISLSEFESFRFDESECEIEKFSEYESFSFDLAVDHDPGGVLKNESFNEKFFPTLPLGKDFKRSLNNKSHNFTIMKFSFDEDEFYKIVIMTFLPFVMFGVVSLILHSVGSEDVVFDPGIVSKHFQH